MLRNVLIWTAHISQIPGKQQQKKSSQIVEHFLKNSSILNVNTTTYVVDGDADISDVPYIFRINYMYYSVLGLIVMVLVGYPISILTGGTENLDEKLLAPFLRKKYVQDRKEQIIQKNLGEMQVLNKREEQEWSQQQETLFKFMWAGSLSIIY